MRARLRYARFTRMQNTFGMEKCVPSMNVNMFVSRIECVAAMNGARFTLISRVVFGVYP